MNLLLILVLAFAPGIFWLWFFYKKDKLEPEPKSLVIKMFFWGMAAVIPAVILEMPAIAYDVLLTVGVAPIVEEVCKFFFAYHLIYKNKEFDEPMDGIVYAVAIALGFASLENAFYLFQAYSQGGLWETSVIRAILSVPGHALFSSMWGYGMGLTKFSTDKKNYMAKGLILACILHGIFNLLCLKFPIGAAGMLILVIIMWRMVNKRIKRALELSPHLQTKTEDNVNTEDIIPETEEKN